MKTRRHSLEIAALVAAALPLGGLLYWAGRGDTRLPADLGVADRCVDQVHTPHGAAPPDPDIEAVCERYFRLRKDAEADTDEQRWQGRHARDQRAGHP